MQGIVHNPNILIPPRISNTLITHRHYLWPLTILSFCPSTHFFSITKILQK